jgi:hypothetical protein
MKLFVAGCSFSDYNYNPSIMTDKVYGDYLSEKLGVDYVHEGAGCGSNYRMWRKITNYIMNGFLTQDDILIVQYTNSTRREFFCNLPYESWKVDNVLKTTAAFEPYGTEKIMRFKVGEYNTNFKSYEKEEVEFFNLYQKHFLDEKFSMEEFEYNNFMFQHMLINNNIKVIFLRSHFFPNFNLIPFHEKNELSVYELIDNKDLQAHKNDPSHFSKKGHNHLSELIYDHLKNLNWI